jgi:hypothetical protein
MASRFAFFSIAIIYHVQRDCVIIQLNALRNELHNLEVWVLKLPVPLRFSEYPIWNRAAASKEASNLGKLHFSENHPVE